MRFQLPMPRLRTMGLGILLLALAFAWQGQTQAQGVDDIAYPEVETYLVRTSGPNVTGEIPPLDLSCVEEPEEFQVVKPTEVYLVPVSGPNLTGKVPPLDKSRAIALHETNGIRPYGYVRGQWYDHYAYYTLDGTEVEQYTNFEETEHGQYIWLQRWKNNNGGTDRYLKDGWTGYTYNWFDKWLSDDPSLNLGQEYTEGYGTRLQTYYQTNSSSCPCWLADYKVGWH